MLKKWIVAREDTFDGLISRKDLAIQLDEAIETVLMVEKQTMVKRWKNATRRGSI